MANKRDLVIPTRRSARSGIALAQEFGWSDSNFNHRAVNRGGTCLDVARCMVGGEPAALFATVQSENGYDSLDSAALYAYHATVDWGLLAENDGLTVFNSHWLFDGDWFHLPRIAWSEVRRNTEILQALTPSGLVDGAIERIASRWREPSSFLKPVDDELVERLDQWRDQALRYARDMKGIDEGLQTLYAQFFVLRTVEDRGLDKSVPILESVLEGGDSFDRQIWLKILKLARERIGSDLFDNDVSSNISEHVLSGVVRDLYRPRGLPGAHARYDFSWIEADVLGLAYEKYLATILQSAPVAPQMEMFNVPRREVERLTVRKQSGAYYTPKFISVFLATRCVDDFFARVDTDETSARSQKIAIPQEI